MVVFAERSYVTEIGPNAVALKIPQMLFLFLHLS